MLNEQQEKILKHLLLLERSPQNSVAIGNQMSTYPENIDEKELIQILDVLEKSNLIKIRWNSIHHDNLTYAITIDILPEADCYFGKKKITKATNKRDWIRTYIPIVISIAALILSIISLIIKVKN